MVYELEGWEKNNNVSTYIFKFPSYASEEFLVWRSLTYGQ